MAELFLAQSTSPAGPKKPVVIKRLLPHMTNDPHFNAMFIDEAKLTSRLTHPNIVETLEFNRHGDELFMVMEYVDGLDGLALLRECARRKVRLPTEVAVYTVHEVLDALDFAHTQVDDSGEPLGVVHRDISPSNVLLSRHGDIKLVDFGIARATQRHHNTKDGTLKGKYGYMSPEQVVDADIDARSDLFSVGIVLAELLTGRRLFAAHNELDVLLMVRDVRLDRLDKYGGHIGMDLDRVLRKALRKNPDERFSSAAEFRDALAEWLFMRNHEVSRQTIARIVGSLYDEARARRREAMLESEHAREAMAAGAASSRAQAGATTEAQGPGTGGQVQFVALEPSESMPHAQPEEHIDGIPAGHMAGTDSMPMVSIEEDPGTDSMPVVSIEGDPEGAPGAGSAPVISAGEDSPMEASAVESGPAPATVEAGDGVVQAVDSADESLSIDMSDLLTDDDMVEDASGAVPEPVPEPVPPDVTRAVAGHGGAGHAGGSAAPDAPVFDASSFSPMEAAADARDFDDSEVSMLGNPRMPASGAPSGPHMEELPPEAFEDKPDDSGEFSESPPITVLYRLAVARATGLLVTAVGGICKEIYFREGIPEYVSSNVATELFGEYLKQEGVLTSGELSMALAMMPHYSGKLGDTLVGLGLLKPLDVFRYLTRQVRHKLVDVCTWSKGMFRWYGGRENPREAFPLDLNAFEVMGAGALALSDDVIIDWLKTLDLRCRPQAVDDPRITPDVFQLDGIMDDVYSRLDGEHYIAELKAHYKEEGDYDRFVRVLYLLAHTGLASM